MHDYFSPSGSPIVGTKELLTGTAYLLSISDEGVPEYEGSTDVNWSEQKTARNDKGELIFVAEDGSEWACCDLVRGRQ